jgi:hypothetical protein
VLKNSLARLTAAIFETERSVTLLGDSTNQSFAICLPTEFFQQYRRHLAVGAGTSERRLSAPQAGICRDLQLRFEGARFLSTTRLVHLDQNLMLCPVPLPTDTEISSGVAVHPELQGDGKPFGRRATAAYN